jgi:hypothetical protein
MSRPRRRGLTVLSATGGFWQIEQLRVSHSCWSVCRRVGAMTADLALTARWI